MQTLARLVVTLIFIGLIVIGVVFFSVIAIVPKEKLARIQQKDFSSTEQATTKKSFLDFSIFAPIKALIEEVRTPTPTQTATTMPSVATGTSASYPKELPQPQPSQPLAVKEAPSGAIEISFTDSGISPNSFQVKVGDQVALMVANKTAVAHVFTFTDSLFSPVVVGVGAGQAKGITFYALKKGEFTFHCDLPGHEDRGEIGKMIIQ